jgi:hypothetical protein
MILKQKQAQGDSAQNDAEVLHELHKQSSTLLNWRDGPIVGMLKERHPTWGPTSMYSMSEDSSTEKSPSDHQATGSGCKLAFLPSCAGWSKPNDSVGGMSPEKGNVAKDEGYAKNGRTGEDSEIQSHEEKLRAYRSCRSSSTFRVPRVIQKSPSDVPDLLEQESSSGSLASTALTMESCEEGFFSLFHQMLSNGYKLTSGERTLSNQGLNDVEPDGSRSIQSDDESANILPADNTFVEIRDAVRIVRMHASRLGVSEDQLFKAMTEEERQLKSRRTLGS